MSAPEPSAEKPPENQALPPVEDPEAKATFARPPSVTALRRARKTANFDTVGGAALLVGFTWPVVQAFSGGVGGFFAGLLGGILFFFAAAFGSGMVEAAWNGARATSLALLLICIGAGFYWWHALPLLGFGLLGVAAAIGLVMTWRQETTRLQAGLNLSESLTESLLALPERLPAILQTGLDQAVAAHQQIGRSLTTLDDATQRRLIAETADEVLQAFIRQSKRQVELERVVEVGEASPALRALQAEGRARLAAIRQQLVELNEALLLLVVRHDPAATGAIVERIEQLHLTAQALDELKREGA